MATAVGGRFARSEMTWASYLLLGYFGYLQTVLGPVMPFLQRDLHLSYGIAGLHFSAFAAGMVAAGLVGNRASERWGRPLTFWGGAAGMALGACALALGRQVAVTVAGSGVMGLGGTLLLVTIQAVLAQEHGARRAQAVSEANVLASVGSSLAALCVGEVVRHLPIAKVLPYYGSGDLLHLPFNFALLDTPWAARDVARVTRDYDAGLALFPHAWPNYTLGNHDQARLASRLGAEQVRLAGLLLLTLRGTPFLYHGDELGLPNVPIPPDRMQDPWERIQPGAGRDPARAPMVWDTTPRAGFSDGEPWLPLPPGIERLSVAAQRADPTSTLQFYRRLLATRRASPALRWGEYQPLTGAPDEVLAYRRSLAYDPV